MRALKFEKREIDRSDVSASAPARSITLGYTGRKMPLSLSREYRIMTRVTRETQPDDIDCLEHHVCGSSRDRARSPVRKLSSDASFGALMLFIDFLSNCLKNFDNLRIYNRRLYR